MSYKLIKSIIQDSISNDDKILNLFFHLLPKNKHKIFSTLSFYKHISCKEISALTKIPTKDVAAQLCEMIKKDPDFIGFKKEKNKKYYILKEIS